jgi:hypothetical protein
VFYEKIVAIHVAFRRLTRDFDGFASFVFCDANEEFGVRAVHGDDYAMADPRVNS